ncbi:MAG: UvrD-helicase domain-containing protein, partial [Gemmiger sp.]|nr:UvrD-helicase domain-containing protein [Gemmiger sp.]
ARGGSLLVSAAAGSGKTRVLVERTVRMITTDAPPVDADRLLIMTFTNAAAAKLRADIATALAKAVRTPPPGADPARLRRQPLLLQRASIGTVDAFCLHFVQQHFSMLEDIPPDFEIADEAAQERIRQDTLAQVLEEAYADPDFCAFADLYDRGRTDATAAQTVLELYNFLASTADPDATLAGFTAAWQSDAPLAATVWGQYLTGEALQKLGAARRLTEAALAAAGRDPAAATAFTAALQDDDDWLALVADRLRHGRWDDALAALRAWGKGTPAGRIAGGRGSNASAATAAELRKKVRDQLADLQKNLLLCTAESYAADRAAAAPLVAALCRVTGLFSARYFAAKRAEKLLDYADCEHLTLRLLVDAQGARTPLCGTVSAHFAAVLVDEYQDTNALQDAIYFALANPEGSNLFFVGDIKQSIYRFRQAEPDIFIEKQQKWNPYPPPAPGQSAAIALDANFRSAPGVVAGINYIFETIFSERLGGVAYGPGQRLVAGAKPLPGQPPYPGLCELDAVLGDKTADAAVVAGRIAQMVQQGFAVRGKTGQRPCTYGDFCILLRGRADFDVYEAALQARGIPVFADTAGDLLDAPHVRPFAALLQVIDNPAQDVELAAVLLSPLFSVTPDDLIRLRKATPKGSLYGAVLNAAQPVFQEFCRTLRSFRRLARTLPVDALLEELFARTGYLAAVGAMPDGPACREELRSFAAWAAGAGRAGLPGVIRAMNAARRHGGLRQSGAGQVRPGCVSIMTVHRSKGLEFPVVFVADTARLFNNSDAIRPVQYHRGLGLGLMLRTADGATRYKTPAYAAVQQAVKAETKSEEMRVLYVALTRAQDALIITVPLKNPESDLKTPALYAHAGVTGPAALQGMRSWGEWLLTAALCHPAGAALWQYVGWLPCQATATAPLVVEIIEPPAPTEAPPPPAPAVADPALQAALLAGFGWQSPDAPLRDIPAKVSVTAVVHAARPTVLQRPAFLQKGGLTGAERGTAIHAFLQNVPFDAAGPAPELADEVERQKAAALLSPELAEKLELAPLQGFFDGPVWRRIRLAKTILREEPFITALPAGEVSPAAGDSTANVLVQGIADVVLVFDDHAEILDYKTDRNPDPAFYATEYGGQLRLYRRAFALRLPVPVTKLTIYSFALGGEVDIPLNAPANPRQGEE